MTAKLDVAKMEAAFKRAAHKALHGTREERSGRFLLKQQAGSATPKSAGSVERSETRRDGRRRKD